MIVRAATGAASGTHVDSGMAVEVAGMIVRGVTADLIAAAGSPGHRYPRTSRRRISIPRCAVIC